MPFVVRTILARKAVESGNLAFEQYRGIENPHRPTSINYDLCRLREILIGKAMYILEDLDLERVFLPRNFF